MGWGKEFVEFYPQIAFIFSVKQETRSIYEVVKSLDKVTLYLRNLNPD